MLLNFVFIYVISNIRLYCTISLGLIEDEVFVNEDQLPIPRIGVNTVALAAELLSVFLYDLGHLNLADRDRVGDSFLFLN